MSVALLPFLAVSLMVCSTCLSRVLSFLSAILPSPSVSSFSLLLLPLFCRTSLTRSRWLQRFAPQPVLPAPWRPTSTRTSTSLRASCQARSLLAGPHLLPFGGLCQRGVETQAATPSCPITRNTFLEVRWVCVFAYSLSLSLTLSAQFVRLSLHTTARAFPALSPLSRSPLLLPPSSIRLRLRLLLSLYLFFFLFVLPSSSSSSLPLLLLCVFLFSRRLLLCFRLS